MFGAILALAVSAGVQNVKDHGAKGDGVTYDTFAIRAAAAAVTAAGGGTVLFPGPGTYLTGSFNVTSHTRVIIEPRATVLGSTKGDDWPPVVAREVWPQFGHGSDCVPGSPECRLMHQSLLFAWDATNVSMTGGGNFDCNSQPGTWWGCAAHLDAPPCSGHSRPHCIMLANVTDVEVSNIHVSNSPDWTLHFSSCTRVYIHHLNVTNPLSAPNADGIDIDSSQDVLVEHNFFSVGDDALCVKSGIDWFGRTYGRPAKNIMFRNNRIGTGHGITIGSEMSGGVHNVTFENIQMDNTGTGIRMKSMRGRGGEVSNVTYRNINMVDIQGQCVQVTLNYHEAAPTNRTATPVFNNILIEDVVCHKGKNSYLLDGLLEQSILGLTLRNVTMGPNVGGEAGCDHVECTCDALTSPCPSCCKGVHPPPGPAPPSPPPAPTPNCTVTATIGCFDDSADPAGPAVLPLYVAALHDHVTLANCATACYSDGHTIAGIDGGNHCKCGRAADLAAATKAQLNKAMDECSPKSCPHTFGDRCSCTGAVGESCGATGRLVAFNFECS